MAAQWEKLRMADFGRLMQDNQRVLNMTAATNQENRRQTSQLRGQQAQAAGAQVNPAPDTEADDMGNILIDSPTTINYPPAQPATKAPRGNGGVAAAATGVALLLAGVAGGALLMRQPAPAAPAPITAPAPPTVTPPTTGKALSPFDVRVPWRFDQKTGKVEWGTPQVSPVTPGG